MTTQPEPRSVTEALEAAATLAVKSGDTFRGREQLIAALHPAPAVEHEPWCWRRHVGDCVDGPSDPASAVVPDVEAAHREAIARAVVAYNAHMAAIRAEGRGALDVEDLMDFVAMAQHIRAEHEATHGEAEMCGAECIVLGLDERAEGRGALDVDVLAQAIRDEAFDCFDDFAIAARSLATRYVAILAQREPAESQGPDGGRE